MHTAVARRKRPFTLIRRITLLNHKTNKEKLFLKKQKGQVREVKQMCYSLLMKTGRKIDGRSWDFSLVSRWK